LLGPAVSYVAHNIRGGTIDIPPDLVEELRQLKTDQDALRKEYGRSTATWASTARWYSASRMGRRFHWENIARETSGASSSAPGSR
jgi:hypothetical protein